MTITIPPELAKRFEELARFRGTTPEEAVQEIEANISAPHVQKLSREEFAATLASIAKPSTNLIPHSALSREELYD